MCLLRLQLTQQISQVNTRFRSRQASGIEANNFMSKCNERLTKDHLK